MQLRLWPIELPGEAGETERKFAVFASSAEMTIRHLPKLSEEEGALRGYGYGVATDIAEDGGLSIIALG